MIMRRLTTVLTSLTIALIVASIALQGAFAQQSSSNSVVKGPGMPKVPLVNGKVKLTKSQRAEFVKKAKEVAGLSDAGIRKALEDPKVFAGIPTSVENSVTRSDNRQMQLSLATARTFSPQYITCNTMRKSLTYNSWYGTKLYVFRIYKHYCRNGYRVTSVPWIVDRSYVTQYGTFIGYKYYGVQQRTNNYSYALGNWHGRHRTFSRGLFRQCPVIKSVVTCIAARRPYITEIVYGNGKWVFRWGAN